MLPTISHKIRYILLWGFPVIILLLLAGCTIDEYIGPEYGDLFVSAMDDSGHVVLGAAVYLDGVLRSEVTPDTLKNILSGVHSLRIEKYGYYVFEDTDVLVESYTVTTYQADLEISPTGALSVILTGGPGMVIVDGQALDMEAPAIFPEVPVGSHGASVFRAGYLTCPDTLRHVTIVWQDTATVQFELTQGTCGHQVGNVGPDFALQNDNLDSVSLHNYRGRVILVDFWYQDCFFCMLEFPDLEQVYQEYAHHGFQILAVNPYDPLEVVIEVREDPNLLPTFQLLMDPDHVVEGLFGVSIYPTNILIDGSGEIRYRFGHTTAEELRSMLQDIYGFNP